MKWTNAWAGAWLVAGTWAPCVSGERAPERAAPTEPPPATASSAAGAPTSPNPGQVAQTPTAKAYMRGHFAESEAMRRAIVAGDLRGLHDAARSLAGDEWTPNLRADWRPHVSAVRAAAQSAHTALSLEEGAAALGQLGQSCATCHQSTGGPRIPSPSAWLGVERDRGMVAHDTAMGKLWAGLVAPSDALWLEGSRQMLAAPELDSDVADISALSRRVRDLARRGEVAEPPSRARLFSEVMLTCASCHQRVGVSTPRSRDDTTQSGKAP